MTTQQRFCKWRSASSKHPSDLYGLFQLPAWWCKGVRGGQLASRVKRQAVCTTAVLQFCDCARTPFLPHHAYVYMVENEICARCVPYEQEAVIACVGVVVVTACVHMLCHGRCPTRTP